MTVLQRPPTQTKGEVEFKLSCITVLHTVCLCSYDSLCEHRFASHAAGWAVAMIAHPVVVIILTGFEGCTWQNNESKMTELAHTA